MLPTLKILPTLADFIALPIYAHLHSTDVLGAFANLSLPWNYTAKLF